MNKIFVIATISLVIAGVVTVSFLSEQSAVAPSTKKIHFTKTITSSQDPGLGHENHQLAVILSPNKGTLYDGSLTYAASEPVQIVILHEIEKDEAKGQPTWTVDGETIYGLTLIEPSASSGTLEFTGTALALHTESDSEFTSTVSVDGWIRGQAPQIIEQKIEVKSEPEFKLSKTNVPATIPLHEGFYNGESLYYIITDTNGEKHAELITEKQKWKVELAPPLSHVPEDALQTVYMFTDGIEGNGIHGYQSEVFSSTPKQVQQYSALQSVTHVSWKPGQNAEILDSVDSILTAEEDGRIVLEKTEVVINMPQIVWPGGQMLVKDDQEITDTTPYGDGQILDISLENMTTTFVAHRGWGPDGRTIYYIVTDATPKGPADLMGVTNAPSSGNLISHAAAVDLFQFQNGIPGSGPLGFQPGIAAAALGDENYSPMWRIYMIEWNDPAQAKILETKTDIDIFKDEGLINVNLARPMNSNHIVNCPFIDPFQ